MKEMKGWKNKLYFGDNLAILGEHVQDESVDLIYLDPPFNSKATYNVLFQEESGEGSAAQITAFDDTWHWGTESEYAYQEIVRESPKKLADLIQALRMFLGQNDMMAYLTMMAQRMVELHRVLKPTGSIYLHCDPTASHYLKLLMDAVFGGRNFQNELIWCYEGRELSQKRWNRKHDVLLFYTKGSQWTFNWHEVMLPLKESSRLALSQHIDEQGRPFILRYKRGGGFAPIEKDTSSETYRQLVPHGVPPRDWLLCDYERKSKRLGYETQKPEALLERFVAASSNEGDLVLDPFCGCGTTIAVSERLKRRWIGIDITHLAITLMRHRLNDTFGPDLTAYEVIGDPKDLASAQALAEQNRYQFEWWALGLVDARPAQDKRKGADRGVDGYINFFDDNIGKAKAIIVQVKSGGVKRGDIATLKGDMEREKAPIGVFITLEEPTRPMLQEAAAGGFYEPEHFPGNQYPHLQILTIRELLEGKEAQYPRMAPPATFKRAQRHRRSSAKQSGFMPHSNEATP